MTIKNNLQQIQNKIIETAKQCNRDAKAIKLLAVSKNKSTSQIAEAIKAGQQLFGENYVQEGIEKIHYFKRYYPDIPLEWHFIGSLQSNKSRAVAENFDWVHTIDRLKIAKRLNEQRPNHLPPLNILIQVNISHEESKSGISPCELAILAQEITGLSHLKLRGLMAIPQPQSIFEEQFATFDKMNGLYQQLKNNFPNIDTLSMGMSDDMQVAIMAGSSMVRVGTAIFGARLYN